MLQQALPVEPGEVGSLYPPAPPRAKLAGLRIADLPVEPVKPEGWLLYSIRKRGVCEPIVVLDYGDEGYRVKAGKRRVEAARHLKMQYVPAYVFDAEDWKDGADAALALLSNNQRSNNAVDEFDAIVELAVKRRISVAEIAEATGITVPSVRAALTLTALPASIIEAMRQWKVKYAVCRRIVTLSHTSQLALAAVLEKNGTITAKDVRPYWLEERRQPKSGDVFAGDAIHTWTTSTVDALKEAFEKRPAGVPQLAVASIGLAIGALTGAPDGSQN